MDRWKVRASLLLSVIELLFLSLTVEALQGKTCQTWLLSGEGGSVWAKISGGRARPWGIFFGFYNTRHIFLSDIANCTVLRAVVLTQYWRVTDRRTNRQTNGRTNGQMDGIAIASTALAMRALRRAVKTHPQLLRNLPADRLKGRMTNSKHISYSPAWRRKSKIDFGWRPIVTRTHQEMR